jgi:hypothetical protein
LLHLNGHLVVIASKQKTRYQSDMQVMAEAGRWPRNCGRNTMTREANKALNLEAASWLQLADDFEKRAKRK